MKNNPFAKVFRTAFETDILSGAVCIPQSSDRPDIAPRVSCFLNELNKFLRTNGEKPLLYQKYAIDEHKLLEYALFLRGYMRDSQTILSQLQPHHATDQGLIDLFRASSEYAVACNHQFGNKKIFNNNVDYRLWQIRSTPQSHVETAQNIETSRHNMFLFMPFRIKDNEAELQKWIFMNMQNTMENQQVFGKSVDVYVNFFPIQKSRSSNIHSLLQTIKEPETYYEQTDMLFVQKYWKDFIGQNIIFDEKGQAISGETLKENELLQNFSNISIFAYCSGAANAHRCLNALYDVTSQMYDENTAQKAMQKIEIMTYGFLPLQQHSRYSGIHFYTNAIDDVNRHEPFVNLNNHLLYEQTKCKTDTPARYSVMPDGRNFIVSLRMPEKMTIWRNNQPEQFQDKEFGHSILFLTKENLLDSDNYAYNLFRSAFEQTSLGKRGADILNFTPRSNTNNILLNSHLKGQMQRL